MNMPSGSIDYTTLASGAVSDENIWQEQSLDPALFVSGQNLLAVEMHQNSRTSSDLSSISVLPDSLRRRGDRSFYGVGTDADVGSNHECRSPIPDERRPSIGDGYSWNRDSDRGRFSLLCAWNRYRA